MNATDKQREEQPKAGQGYRVKEYQFQPGQSGNPAGRPKKGDALADMIAEVMESVAGDLTGKPGDDKRTIQQAIIRRMALNAIGGDVKAAQWLADGECGRPYQRVEIEIKGVPLPLVLPEELVDEA